MSALVGYLALGIVIPTTGAFTEVSFAGYVRQPVAFELDVPSAGGAIGTGGDVLRNSNVVNFAAPGTLDWPSVNAYAVFTAAAGGKAQILVPLGARSGVHQRGTVRTFRAGSLILEARGDGLVSALGGRPLLADVASIIGGAVRIGSTSLAGTIPGAVSALTASHFLGMRLNSDDNPSPALANDNAWLGSNIDLVHLFVESGNGGTTWAQNLVIAQNLATAYAAASAAGTVFDIAMPLCSDSQPLTDTTAGTYDAIILQILQILAGFIKAPVIFIRPGWEANYPTYRTATGSQKIGYPWSACSNSPAAYIAAFRHMVDLIRSVDPRFKIQWINGPFTTAADGTTAVDPELHYPGDGYCEITGLDCYYNQPSDNVVTARALWQKRFVSDASVPFAGRSLEWAINFAKTHGKFFSMPEFAVNCDAPDYLEGLAARVRYEPLTHMGYWDKGVKGDPGDPAFIDRLSNNQWPLSAAMFKTLFGPLSIVTPAAITIPVNQAGTLILEANKPLTWSISGTNAFTVASVELVQTSEQVAVATRDGVLSYPALPAGTYSFTLTGTDERGQTVSKAVTVTAAAGAVLPEVQFYASRCATAPTAAYQNAVSTLVAALKSAGVWGLIDAIYLLRNQSSQATVQNLKSSKFTASSINSPAFVANDGVHGDGSSSYYDTGLIPSVPGRKFQQDDSYLGVATSTNAANGTGDSYDIGAGGQYFVRRSQANGNLSGRPSSGSSLTFTPNNSGYPGYFSLARTGPTAWAARLNGSPANNGTDASQSTMHESIKLCGNPGTNQYGVNTLGVVILGAGSIGAQDAAVASAVAAFMSAVSGGTSTPAPTNSILDGSTQIVDGTTQITT